MDKLCDIFTHFFDLLKDGKTIAIIGMVIITGLSLVYLGPKSETIAMAAITGLAGLAQSTTRVRSSDNNQPNGGKTP